MKKELYFEQIHPFVRYARFLKISCETGYPLSIPYDCRLFYTYKGNGEIFINDKVYEMPKGSLMILQSATPYNLLNEHDALYIAFNFDFTYEYFEINQPIPPNTADNYDVKNVLEQIHFIGQPNLNGVIYLNNMETIENQLLEIEYEFKHKKLYFNNKISAVFQDVLLKTARRLSFNYVNDNKTNNKIDQIIDYIQRHYNENISNADISKAFNFHANYINQLMIAHTELSLHQYVISLRISKAIELLEATDMQINEIAYMVGFKDICHFSRYFKKITGRNPRDFKKC